MTGWEPTRQHLNSYVNWYWDCVAWSLLNAWFGPFQIPGLHGEADKWVSQFTLNGVKAGSICRPN
jgi:hypothetical protein